MSTRIYIVIILLLQRISVIGSPGDSLLFERDIPGSWGIEGRLTYGFIIAHREALMPLQQQHLSSAEVSVFKTTNGSRTWESEFLLPEKGIHLSYIQPGSPDKLGNAIALYPYLDFPLYQKDDGFFLLRYGMGLGYIQHVFDPENNYTNVAIGSHFNGVIHIGISFRKKLSAQSNFTIGAGLTHFSNGSFKMPNLGINLPALSIGINKYFGQPEKMKTTKKLSPRMQGTISTFIAGGTKEIYPNLGPRYFSTTLSSTYFFPAKHKSDLGLGLDFFYDNSLSIKNSRENGDSSRSANFRPGIHGSYQLKVASIGVLFDMGFYPYTEYKGDGLFYHRIGLRYYFKDLYACINLKTHYARADFIEWGIGWNFNLKKSAK